MLYLLLLTRAAEQGYPLQARRLAGLFASKAGRDFVMGGAASLVSFPCCQ
jgi:hypothetical protein